MNDLISRQEAIDVLEERLQANGYSNAALVLEFNRSIGYLMRLPSAQRESCEYWDAESNYCTLNRPSAQHLEQKPVKPYRDEYHYYCGNCSDIVSWGEINWKGDADVKANFCKTCGRKVKWID